MIDTESKPGAWQRELDQRPKQHEPLNGEMKFVSITCDGQEFVPKERLEELEAENKLYEDALANYEQADHAVKEENAALRTSVAELAAERDRLLKMLNEPVQLSEWQKMAAERDRLREMGNWLAAEAREDWEAGRFSIDLITAVEAWERAALEGE